ncbi:MAG: Ig-like domain-containing protein [Myxococcaceae bacterium]
MNQRSLSVGCSWRWIPLLAIASLVSGCSHDDGPSRGGGGGPDGGAAAVVARVEVSPGAILLGGPGQTRTLTAKAFNAQGMEITTSFTWNSTRPAEVTVDSAGRVSAAALGSAQVTAAAGGVSSAAVTVLVAETLPGTVLVGDAQVVSVGPVTLVQDGGPGTRYEVRLRGISPAPAAGTILLASESAQVAGKVVSTRDESGTLVATLELRPLHELLGRYHIDWDLEVGPYAEDDALAQVTTPGSAPAALRQRLAATAVLRPFTAASCAFDFEASLFKKTISLSPSSSLRWMVVETRDDPNQGPTYVKHALVGEFSLTGSVEVGLNAELSVSGTCLAQLPPIRIAAFGAVSVLVMPAVRLGVGVELSGTLHIATGTVGISGKVGVQPEIGWECGPAPLPCRGLANLSEIREVTPKLEAPSIHGLKVELHGQVFALVGLDLAVLGGLGGYFGIAEARIGPKQSATLAFEDDQAHEPGSSSSYDLKLSGSIGPGPGLSAAIKKVIDDDSVSVDLRFRRDVSLSESPKGTLTVDKEKAGINEQVKLTVDITPQTTSYVGIGYNVVSIQIFRKKPGENVFERDQDLEIVPSASNQTHFEKVWKPKEADVGKNELAAFVHTEVHDTGILPLLEIADDSRKQVEVQAICLSGLRAARGVPALVVQQQQGGDCTVNGTLRHVVTTGTGAEGTTSTGQGSVKFVQDATSSSGSQIVFRPDPSSTCSVVIDGTQGGCTVHATSTMCSFITDRSALAVNIDSSTDPPTYTYDAMVGANVTLHESIDCPGGPDTQFDVPTIESLMMAPATEHFTVDADGKTLRNNYTVGMAPLTETWTWDLTLDIPAPPP